MYIGHRKEIQNLTFRELAFFERIKELWVACGLPFFRYYP